MEFEEILKQEIDESIKHLEEVCESLELFGDEDTNGKYDRVSGELSLNTYGAISKTIALLEFYNKNFDDPTSKENEEFYRTRGKKVHNALVNLLSLRFEL